MTEKIEQPYIGGLNLAAEDLAVHPSSVPDAMNVEFGQGGRIKQRGGSTSAVRTVQAVFTPSAINMFTVEEDNPTTAQVAQLVIISGSVYHFIDAADGTPVTVGQYAGGYPLTGGRNVARPEGVAFNDTLAVPGAITRYTVISTGGVALPMAVPFGGIGIVLNHPDWLLANGFPTTLAAYGGRMWYAGVEKFPERLYVTDIGAVGTFTANKGFTLDMQLVDGGRIIAMKHIYDILLVFTTRGVYRIIPTTGTIPFKAIQISTDVAVAASSIVQAENSVYVMTRGGVQKLSTTLAYGDVTGDILSSAISPIFDSADSYELEGAVGVYNRSRREIQFYLQHQYTGFAHPQLVANTGTLAASQAARIAGAEHIPPSMSTAMVFSLRAQNWAYHSWPFTFSHVVARDRGDGNTVTEAYASIPGSNNTFKEYALFDDTAPDDAGTASLAYMRTRKFTFETMSRRKSRLFAHSYVKIGTPGLNSSFDDAPDKAVSAALPTGYSRKSVTGSGMAAQLEYHGTVGTPWELDAISPDVKPMGRR